MSTPNPKLKITGSGIIIALCILLFTILATDAFANAVLPGQYTSIWEMLAESRQRPD